MVTLHCIQHKHGSYKEAIPYRDKPILNIQTCLTAHIVHFVAEDHIVCKSLWARPLYGQLRHCRMQLQVSQPATGPYFGVNMQGC